MESDTEQVRGKTAITTVDNSSPLRKFKSRRASAFINLESSPNNNRDYSIGIEGEEEKEKTIFDDWDQPPVNHAKTKALYKETIDKIVDNHGGFPEFKLTNIPTYRTEKHSIIKKTQQENPGQFIPNWVSNDIPSKGIPGSDE